MDYGLRRYEAGHRLAWFVYFLACLVLAYPMSGSWVAGLGGATVPQGIQLNMLKNMSFWMGFQWAQVQPLGRVLAYIAWVAALFLGFRALWLVLQFMGKSLARVVLGRTLLHTSGRPRTNLDNIATNIEFIFPVELLLRKIRRFPLQLLFHPFRRLRLMLTNPQGLPSTEEVIEKERRMVEIDWQVMAGSWAPFGWIVWLLPLMALVQTAWLLYLQVQPAVVGQKDIESIVQPALGSFAPLLQVVGLAIFFTLASGLVRRLEQFYLSGLDALFYDKLLSRIPFQSGDTVILLEALQRHFQEMHAVLRRLERTLEGPRNPQNPKL